MINRSWLPEPSSLAVAVLAGGIIGFIEARADERRRRARAQSEVWNQAGVFESVDGAASSNGSADTADGTATDSGLPLPELPPMAFYEQEPNQEEN